MNLVLKGVSKFSLAYHLQHQLIDLKFWLFIGSYTYMQTNERNLEWKFLPITSADMFWPLMTLIYTLYTVIGFPTVCKRQPHSQADCKFQSCVSLSFRSVKNIKEFPETSSKQKVEFYTFEYNKVCISSN